MNAINRFSGSVEIFSGHVWLTSPLKEKMVRTAYANEKLSKCSYDSEFQTEGVLN